MDQAKEKGSITAFIIIYGRVFFFPVFWLVLGIVPITTGYDIAGLFAEQAQGRHFWLRYLIPIARYVPYALILYGICAVISIFFVKGLVKSVEEAWKPKNAVSQEEVEKMQDWLLSSYMRKFETRNAVSYEEENWLIYGAILMAMNGESSKIFAVYHINSRKEVAFHQINLKEGWGIETVDDALETAAALSACEVHTELADFAYNHFAKKGIESVAEEDLANLQMPLGVEIERINTGLAAYKRTTELLIAKLGYTKSELSGITTLAAWDLGRVAYIARFSIAVSTTVNINRQDAEKEMWDHIKKAAREAKMHYSSLREFYAAYYMGRALAYCQDCSDQIDVTRKYLFDPQEGLYR